MNPSFLDFFFSEFADFYEAKDANTKTTTLSSSYLLSVGFLDGLEQIVGQLDGLRTVAAQQAAGRRRILALIRRNVAGRGGRRREFASHYGTGRDAGQTAGRLLGRFHGRVLFDVNRQFVFGRLTSQRADDGLATLPLRVLPQLRRRRRDGRQLRKKNLTN